jgi:hypothetical protein
VELEGSFADALSVREVVLVAYRCLEEIVPRDRIDLRCAAVRDNHVYLATALPVLMHQISRLD